MEAEGAGCRTLYPAAMLLALCGQNRNDENRDAFQHLRLPGGSLAILRPQLTQLRGFAFHFRSHLQELPVPDTRRVPNRL